MTREQEVERRLSEWLEDGPVTAPPEIVDGALERAAGRRQRRGLGRWLALPVVLTERWFPTQRLARATALAVVLAGVLLTGLLVSAPFDGGPGLAPEMDRERVEAVAGVALVTDETAESGLLDRTLQVEVDDPRIDGEARQAVELQVDTESGMTFGRGRMRLDNAWGAWEGPLDFTAYPSGAEHEYASLVGSGTYDGFTYLYTVRQATSEAERTVEGAIWPDEPPPLPDPSLLP